MKYMLMRTAPSAKVFLVAGMREVQLHARLLALTEHSARLAAPPVEGRSFSRLPEHQLAHLISSLGATPSEDYGDRVAQALALVDALPVDTTPLASLEKRCEREHAPLALLDGTQPAPLPAPEKPRKAPQIKPEVPKTPRVAGATQRVWALADGLAASLGRLPTGKEVVDACATEGINKGTASVQYGKWRKEQNIS